MEMDEKNQPIFNERVKEIIKELSKGRTREELASEFGFKNYKTLDCYMRRKHFTWDKINKNYVPKVQKSKAKEVQYINGKVERIIQLVKENEGDVRECAKKMGFQDHKQLASYMASKGYTWDTEKGCYTRSNLQIEEAVVQSKESIIEKEEEIQLKPNSIEGLDRYLPLLRKLEANYEQLEELLTNKHLSSGQIPTFTIPGVSGTKTVQMINSLNVLIQEFAVQKNISQRRVFEVALIEFFQKYGFKREIDSLLKSY